MNTLKAGDGNIADMLGLPTGSEASIYDVYRITPKPGEYPIVFKSTVARTREGAIMRPGGGEQALVPNRSQFTDPELIEKLREGSR